jgi:hypothetical protein
MLQWGKVLVCTNLDCFSVSASAGTILVHPVFLEQPSKNMSLFEVAKAPSFLLDGEDIGAIEGLSMSGCEVGDSKLCIWEERRQEQEKRSGFSPQCFPARGEGKNIGYFSIQVFPWHHWWGGVCGERAGQDLPRSRLARAGASNTAGER